MARSKASGPDRKPHDGTPRLGAPPEGTHTRRGAANRAPRRARAVAMVIEGKRYGAICDELGIVPSTLYQWLREPDAAEALRKHSAALIESAHTRMVLGVHADVDELDKLSQVASKTDGPRVKALELKLRVVGLLGGDGKREAAPDDAELIPDDELPARIADALKRLGQT